MASSRSWMTGASNRILKLVLVELRRERKEALAHRQHVSTQLEELQEKVASLQAQIRSG